MFLNNYGFKFSRYGFIGGAFEIELIVEGLRVEDVN